MRRSKDFRRTTRRGLRVSRPTLVVHAVRFDDGRLDDGRLDEGHLGDGPRVGLVVSGAVGNAVTRNRVKRRLRHLAAAQIPADKISADGIGIVVRALPQAATSPTELPADFESAWHEAMSRLRVSPPTERGIR
jgi:ribonuclease P protein component